MSPPGHPSGGRRKRTWLRSVRFRVTAVAAVAAAVVLVGVSAALLRVQWVQLTDNLDTSLVQRADDVESLVAAAEDDPGELSLVSGAGDDAVAQIVAPDGTVLASSHPSADVPLADAPAGPDDVLTNSEEIPVEDDEYRILSRRIETGAGHVTVHVAVNTDERNEVVAQLRGAAMVVVPLAVLLLAALVWFLVGRVLRPVEAIRTEVEGIGGTDLDRRVPEPGTGDEIDRLAVTMNELLDRLQEAALRQQRFVSDASHELRSPLTRMRSELEVENRAPVDDRRPLDEIVASVVGEIDEMSVLVDDLLVLARLDAGELPAREVVDLDDVVLQEIDRVDPGTIRLDSHGVSAASVRGVPSEIQRVVRNLLDNAVRHARARVEVRLGQSADGGIVLSVADDGAGIPPGERTAVFERFARLDRDRGRGGGGVGLGLAITREIVDRHGGTVTVDDSSLGGALFTVTLPVPA